MVQRKVAVASRSGLHARPAALFTQAVARTGRQVLIGRAGQPPVNAGSILMVMSLGIGHRDEVELSSPDDDAGGALDELVRLLATDLDDR